MHGHSFSFEFCCRFTHALGRAKQPMRSSLVQGRGGLDRKKASEETRLPTQHCTAHPATHTILRRLLQHFLALYGMAGRQRLLHPNRILLPGGGERITLLQARFSPSLLAGSPPPHASCLPKRRRKGLPSPPTCVSKCEEEEREKMD